MGAETLDAVAVATDHGLHWLEGDLAELVALAAGGETLVGAGAGMLAAAAANALAGRDGGFVRTAAKHHGSGRLIEGPLDPAVPSVVVGGRAGDVEQAAAAGLTVKQGLLCPAATAGSPPVQLPRLEGDAPRPVELERRAKVLRGRRFERSSGEIVDYYFETLEPAHDFDVARGLASEFSEPWRPSHVVGVMTGGVYLAAVLARAFGAVPLMIDPDHEYPETWSSSHLAGDVLFVDDLVNSGSDFGRCAGLAARSGAANVAFLALYAFRTPSPPFRVACILPAPNEDSLA